MSEEQASSRHSVEQATETYDPYKFRTFGRISDFYAFLHLVKCSFGTGVLTFPYGFKNAGMIIGFVIGILTSIFLIYCFHMLIKNMMRIAADQQVPYTSFGEAVKHSFTVRGGKCTRVAKYSSVFIDTVIALYHFGICTAYIVYLVASCLTMSRHKDMAEGPVNSVRTIATLIWVVPLFMINCLRDLRLLMPVSLIGNITTMGSMMVIVYYILAPDNVGFSKDWQYVGTFEKAPLFIGTVLFAVESFGVPCGSSSSDDGNRVILLVPSTVLRRLRYFLGNLLGAKSSKMEISLGNRVQIRYHPSNRTDRPYHTQVGSHRQPHRMHMHHLPGSHHTCAPRVQLLLQRPPMGKAWRSHQRHYHYGSRISRFRHRHVLVCIRPYHGIHWVVNVKLEPPEDSSETCYTPASNGQSTLGRDLCD